MSISLVVQALLTLLGILILLACLKKLAPNRAGWRDWLGQFVLGVVLLLLAPWIGRLAPTEPDPDYLLLYRPYVDLELVVTEKLDADEVLFHFDATNVGKLPANDVRFGVSWEQVQHRESVLPAPRVLAPGATMEVVGSPCATCIARSNKGYAGIEVKASYNGEVGGQRKYFTSTYTFNIPPGRITPGRFRYEYSNHAEDSSPKSAIDDPNFILSAFARDSAAIIAVLNERVNGEVNRVEANSGGRHFIFDPAKRIALFQSTDSDGQVYTAQQPLGESPNGYHVVTLRWGAGYARLDVTNSHD